MRYAAAMTDTRPTLGEALAHPQTFAGQIAAGVVVALVAGAVADWLRRAWRASR